jgi:hypothetical protein
MAESILERWDITAEELTEVIDRNPSLRGMIIGYLAESKLERIWLSGQGISNVVKHDDHDRKKKGDRVIIYKEHEFIFESKSLQTAMIQRTGEGWIYLLVQPSGTRSCIQRLVVRGRRRELGLGSIPFVSFAEARETAVANRKVAREGVDPLADKHHVRAMPTVAEAAESVLE